MTDEEREKCEDEYDVWGVDDAGWQSSFC